VSETELIERARAGDADAFGELVERHKVAVYRAARIALRSADEAEDVAQEAFVAAYRKLGEFRGEASFKTWLLAITWNFARSRRRTARLFLQRFTSSDEREVQDPPARDPSHEDQLIRPTFAGVRSHDAPREVQGRHAARLRGDHTMEIRVVLGIPTRTVSGG
jgi:RNA polymerase sigma-70 factor (ECF subfamily)